MSVAPKSNSILTPLHRLPTGTGVLYVKDETKQIGGAFKFRGPDYFFAKNPDIRSVVTASSGNHAIGVARAAALHKAQARIFVPQTTPKAKIDKIKAAGGLIEYVDGPYESALEKATDYARAHDVTLLPSYDHPMIIEGNRAIFQEAFAQSPVSFDRISVPVGGGGCVSGAIEETAHTDIEILAAEYEPYQRIDTIAIKEACDVLDMVRTEEPSTEGIAVRTLGKLNRAILKNCARLRIEQVTYAELLSACQALDRELDIRAELGACAGVAAALKNPLEHGNTLAIVTGGNIDAELHKNLVATRL